MRISEESFLFSEQIHCFECVLLHSMLWAVEWIHKSPAAIFSQPTFFANISTALFEKEE